MKYKKWVLGLSMALNIILLFSFVRRKIYLSNHKPDPLAWVDHYNKEKVDEYRDLPLDNTDVVFVGTSLTENFPLEELLPHYKLKNRGIKGNFTRHILQRIDDIVSHHPKKLFIEMGINDLNENNPVDSVFSRYLKTIEIITKAGVPLYVQSIFPTRGDYIKTNPAINDLNARLKEYCQQRSIPYVDVYGSLVKDGGLDSALTYDGLHLNIKGYEVWRSKIDSLIN